MAANGGYKNDLMKTEAGRGALKSVQPGEDTQVYCTSTNGRTRLQNADVRGMMRSVVIYLCAAGSRVAIRRAGAVLRAPENILLNCLTSGAVIQV